MHRIDRITPGVPSGILSRSIRSIRAYSLLVLVLAPGCRNAPRPVAPDPADASISRGVAYLESRQSDDGLWRSETYGVFREPSALSPHVMVTLMALNPGSDVTRRGVVAIARWVEGGKVTATLLNPVYGGAEASWVMGMAGRDAERDAFVDRVREHQYVEVSWWDDDQPVYGGWDDRQQRPRRPAEGFAPIPGGPNLSATLFGIGTLRLAGVPAADPTLQGAAAYVRTCQNPDGGFLFTRTDPARNKAGGRGFELVRPDKIQLGFHSYGSPTADGVRALLACGVPPDDPAVTAARDWLVHHFDAAHHPGTFNPDREVLRDAYYFYWAWSVSHAMRRLGVPADDWAPALSTELIRRQRPDGSWSNRFTDGKEDDPLVATPLALAALETCRQAMAE